MSWMSYLFGPGNLPAYVTEIVSAMTQDKVQSNRTIEV